MADLVATGFERTAVGQLSWPRCRSARRVPPGFCGSRCCGHLLGPWPALTWRGQSLCASLLSTQRNVPQSRLVAELLVAMRALLRAELGRPLSQTWKLFLRCLLRLVQRCAGLVWTWRLSRPLVLGLRRLVPVLLPLHLHCSISASWPTKPHLLRPNALLRRAELTITTSTSPRLFLIS